MQCPLCGQRKARRACPGVGQTICAVCCGSKRLVEIRCPDTCGYLTTARLHPPAAVQRQQQRDIAALGASMAGLTERQSQLLFLLLGVLSREHGDPLRRLVDADVAEAAAALAATYETAAKGLIYDHQPQSVPAQRIVTGWKDLLKELAEQGGARAVERDAAPAFRAIEQGARRAAQDAEDGAYLELVKRLMAEPPGSGGTLTPAERPSGLILPPG